MTMEEIKDDGEMRIKAARIYANYYSHTHMTDLAAKLREAKQTFRYQTFNERLVKIQTGSETFICSEYDDLI